MPIGNMLATFGNRGGLLSRMEESRGVGIRNNLNEYALGSAIRAEEKNNRLGALYSKALGGDQVAEREMAGLDPKFHLEVQTKIQALNEAQRKQLLEENEQYGRMLYMAKDNPQALQQLGLTPEQANMALMKSTALSESLFKTIQDQQVKQQEMEYNRQKDDRAFSLQRRGQDITLRGQDLTNARSRETNMVTASGNTFKDANTLRDEFNKASGDFIKVRDAYSRINAAAANPSAAGDLSLIFNYMKMLDPGSTVREGEFATAQNAAGIPTQVLNMYNRALSGERLAEGQRQDFLGQAGGLYAAQEGNHLKLRSEYERLATRRNVDPQDVIVDYRLDGQGSLKPQNGKGPAKLGDVVEAGGKKYRITKLNADGDHDVEPIP